MKNFLRLLICALLIFVESGVGAGTSGKKILRILGQGPQNLSAEALSVSGGEVSSQVVVEKEGDHGRKKKLAAIQFTETVVVLKPGQGEALVQWAEKALRKYTRFDAEIQVSDVQGRVVMDRQLRGAFIASLVPERSSKQGAELRIMPQSQRTTRR